MLLLLSPAVAVFGPVAVLLVHSLLDLFMHSSLVVMHSSSVH
jgi:hypothetical protein